MFLRFITFVVKFSAMGKTVNSQGLLAGKRIVSCDIGSL